MMRTWWRISGPRAIQTAAMAAAVLAGPAMRSVLAESSAVTSLTLVTYNLHVGVPMGEAIGPYRAGWKDILAQAHVLRDARADIAALQEVDSEFGLTLPPERHRSSLIPMPRVMAHVTGMNYVFGSAQDDIRYPSDNAGYVEWGSGDQWTSNGSEHGEVGNALLSRHSFVRPPENIPLPREEGKERRACIRAELAVPGAGEKPVVVYATHLQHDSASSRVDQMRAILERARRDARAGALVFILGDLNHQAPDEERAAAGPDKDGQGRPGSRENPIALALEGGFHDLHALHAAGKSTHPEPTYPADAPRQRIDFILCSRPLKVTEAAVIPTLASDHLPVRVTVELPGD